MRRAGAASFAALRRRWPTARGIAVVCGPGNNGGDGWVVANLAQEAGLAPVVCAIGDMNTLGADAAAARSAALAAGVEVRPDLSAVGSSELIVDALFGIGLTRAAEGEYRFAIDAMNATARPILAIDVPSGLNADTGASPGSVVNAEATITFIGLKSGLVTGMAADYVGALEVDTLGIPGAVFDSVTARGQRHSYADLRSLLPVRRRAAHKGDFGHVLIIGGAPGYAGAGRLAAEAALRSGAGLVSAAVHPDCAGLLNLGRPEIMTHAVADARGLAALLERASVVAVGPGLAQTAWSVELFAAVRDTALPLIVDADALNLLARDPQHRNDWCLTPHPGEAARLLGFTSASEINADRYAAAAALIARYGGVTVLKGAGSLVSGDGRLEVIAGGNPGMASGGMGDVLTGIVAGLVGQGLGLFDAARTGAALHAAAGDTAAQAGARGLLASDQIGRAHV